VLPWPGWAWKAGGLCVALGFGGLVVPAAGCSTRSCEDASDEYYGRLVECGADFSTDFEPPCSEVRREYYECLVSCVATASCEAIRSEDPEGTGEVVACQDYCTFFIDEALKSRGKH
jgi:hypothetical protein